MRDAVGVPVDRLGRRRVARADVADALRVTDAALVASIVHENPEGLPGLRREMASPAASSCDRGGEMSEELRAAIVQDDDTGRVLMLGWMDDEALAADALDRARALLLAHRRQRLWRKGETSGNSLRVVEVVPDCDDDAVLVRAGPTVRPATTARRRASRRGSGARSCAASPRPSPAPTSRPALAEGTPALARKVGEEAVELVVAALAEGDDRVVAEAADLWFHVLLLLRSRGLDPAAVEDELRARER